MIEKNHILSILRINGLSENASQVEIEALLKHSGWHQRDIDAAFYVLNSEVSMSPNQHEELYRALHSDGMLNPDELTDILGFDVTYEDTTPEVVKSKMERSKSGSQSLIELISYSLVAAFIIGTVGYVIFYFDITLADFKL